MDYTPNELAVIDLIGDINKTFDFVGEENEPRICDGDIRQLDKAVKKFKTQVWANGLV
tara:strand:- start:404 stop:577 length:174 start_codon:yes stop_codon:yes gene_type:complete